MAERVKAGFYRAKAAKTEDGTYVQLGLSKKSGTKQALVMFEILDGEYKGTRLPWFGYFTPDAAERTLDSFRLMGWTGKTVKSLLDATLDQPVSITVETHTWEGKTNSRVAWVNDMAGPEITLEKKLDKKASEALDAMFSEFAE